MFAVHTLDCSAVPCEDGEGGTHEGQIADLVSDKVAFLLEQKLHGLGPAERENAEEIS